VWKEPGIAKKFRAGVSLHSHTSHSREILSFIPYMSGKIPLLRWMISRLEARSQRKSGIRVDFGKGYWTPPLPPLAALELERGQIERELDLRAMVSLTDHDNVEAPMLLRTIHASGDIPVSLEWSVPYRDTELHVGIHNLPGERAESIVAQLNSYTENPSDALLGDLLASLNSLPEVLLVLNHPMWDMSGIGRQRHVQTLSAFTAAFGAYLHAFELNGLRDWEENRRVVDFAHGWNQLVIAGGDRHGCEPGAVVNLTEADTFPEFVHQIRKLRRSHVLFMQHYREPLPLRLVLSVLDILRDYPDYSAGSRRWDERVFHPNARGEVRSLADMWNVPPPLIRCFVNGVHLFESAPVQQMMKVALGRPHEELRLALGEQQEVAP
jgi:hypothetical protein